ncbi:MAG: hypothetical protein PHG48_05535, partial [Eubacteriales bacterium]|nr:hypothetical protein [Eubacteriales bacterium]
MAASVFHTPDTATDGATSDLLFTSENKVITASAGSSAASPENGALDDLITTLTYKAPPYDPLYHYFGDDIITKIKRSVIKPPETTHQASDNILSQPQINLGLPENYTRIDGISTFRGNNFRNSASYGYAKVTEARLEIVWRKNLGYIDEWTGIGWPGQAVIVRWDESVRKLMDLNPSKAGVAGLKEVIAASLDGNIYFLDLEDGIETRPPIMTGAPHKAGVTIDPRGYPLLYAGQGIDTVRGVNVPIGFRIYSLIDRSLLFFLNGLDIHASRYWGAFDSSPVFDTAADTLFLCGENALFYKIKLNSRFNTSDGVVELEPQITRYKYDLLKGLRSGIE